MTKAEGHMANKHPQKQEPTTQRHQTTTKDF